MRTGTAVGSTAKRPEPSESVSARRRLLVVEDDRPIQEALRRLLVDHGYEVQVASTGLQALDLLRRSPAPDAILLDLVLPIMDGWQFRLAQRQDPDLARIPVVACSADPGPRAAAIDAAAFLHKPLRAASLLSTLDRVILDQARTLLRPAAATAGTSAANAAIVSASDCLSPSLDIARHKLVQASRLLAASDHVSRDPAELRDGLARAQATMAEAMDRLAWMSGVIDTMGALRLAADTMAPVDIELAVERGLSGALEGAPSGLSILRHYDDVPPVVGIEPRLRLLFLHLCRNAFDCCQHQESQEVVITISSAGERVAVEVRDRGAGIPASLLPRIFDPFFTTRRSRASAGLGLSLCRQIVTEHGGRLDVLSTPGAGTAVRVELPRSPRSMLAEAAWGEERDRSPDDGGRGEGTGVNDAET